MATRPPTRQPRKPAAKRPAAATATTRLALKFRWPPRRWMRIALLALSVCAVLSVGVITYFWISYGRLIDARLLGEQRVVPRIFCRPFEIRVGQGITPALLPRADSLSGLSSTQQFTSVGYGAYEVTNEPGGHRYLYDDVRMVATGTLNAVNKTWLRISMNPSTGNGGTCYGDSGGPNFLGNVLAATTITGDMVCRSINVVYRLDTDVARAFLAQYVTLP